MLRYFSPLHDKHQLPLGYTLGVASFVCWGFFPLYWKLFQHSSSLLVTNWRILFTIVTLYLVLFLKKEFPKMLEIIKNKNLLLLLFTSNICITANWFFFIWSIQQNEAWQSSLGYYLSPILTVIMGWVFLKEKLSIYTKLSCFIATMGICFLFFEEKNLPIYAILLALTFSAYGLLKKKINLPPYLSLTFEVTTILPFCIFYLFWSHWHSVSIHPISHVSMGFTWLILCLSGPLTIIPLVLYSRSAQLIPLNNLGMLQFISPTIQFFVAFFIFKEPFSQNKLFAFVFIWVALVFYILSPLWHFFSNNVRIKPRN
jgi:chloramphenicol-sensitive protein RarD